MLREYSHSSVRCVCVRDLQLSIGGECKQVIRVPATSVWSVWCMKNGDIVAGSRYCVTCGISDFMEL